MTGQTEVIVTPQCTQPTSHACIIYPLTIMHATYELPTEKGSSHWLTVIPLKKLDYSLNKKGFRSAIKSRYDWVITGSPKISVCGVKFSLNHAMMCQCGGFIIQRHKELRDLEVEILRMVCNDVEVEPVLPEVSS